MKEILVSLETAKVLKVKGFNEDVLEHYYDDGSTFMDDLNNSECEHDEYSAPNLSLAQQWLREVHNIHMGIWYNTLTHKWRLDYLADLLNGNYIDVDSIEMDTYEQALEAGIKESLKLIK